MTLTRIFPVNLTPETVKTNTAYSKALKDARNAVNAAYAVVQRADPYGRSAILEAARYALDVAETVLDAIRALDIPLRA